jgi:hypothetical protein
LYFLRDREAPQDILDGRRDELPACRPCGAQPDDPQNPLSVHVDGYLICNDCLFKPAVAS